MKFKLSVYSNNVEEKSGTSNRTGNSYTIRKQPAYIYMDPNDPHPEKFEIPLDDNQSPWPPGDYALTPKIKVNQYKSLEIDRFEKPLITKWEESTVTSQSKSESSVTSQPKSVDLKKVG